MKLFWIAAAVLIAVTLVLFAEPALAGPGGKIARALFDTFWGKVLLIVLTIVFLPLIVYVTAREKLSERRTRRDLRFMARYDSRFDWLQLQQRAKDCFLRVHAHWRLEDLSEARAWMTDWYWQNQQRVHLDRWRREGLENCCDVKRREGLENCCDVKRIQHLRPLLFVHRNQGSEHEQSMVVITITARMRDYLQHRTTGKVVEGSKRYKAVETLWSFTMVDGEWKVSDIEEGSMSLSYARMVRELPPIESTIVSDFRA